MHVIVYRNALDRTQCPQGVGVPNDRDTEKSLRVIFFQFCRQIIFDIYGR